jgi:hypothetical protein
LSIVPDPDNYFDYFGANPLYMYELLSANNIIEKIEELENNQDE